MANSTHSVACGWLAVAANALFTTPLSNFFGIGEAFFTTAKA